MKKQVKCFCLKLLLFMGFAFLDKFSNALTSFGAAYSSTFTADFTVKFFAVRL